MKCLHFVLQVFLYGLIGGLKNHYPFNVKKISLFHIHSLTDNYFLNINWRNHIIENPQVKPYKILSSMYVVSFGELRLKFDMYRQVYKSGPRPTTPVLTLLASPPNTSSEDLTQGSEAYTFSSLKNRTPTIAFT